MELVLYLAHQTHAFLLRIEFLRLLQAVHLILFHVEEGEVQQRLLVAPLGDGERHARQFQTEFEGDDDFARTALVTLAHLHDAHGQQLLLGLFEAFLILERERLVHATVGDVQIIDVGRALVFGNGEHVDVVQHGTDHFATRAIGFYQLILLFHSLRFLEAHFGGQRLHLRHQGRAYLARVSLEDFLHLGDAFHIFLMRLGSDAGTFAVLDVIFQAHLELARPNVLRRERQVAGAQLIEAFDEFQHGVHGRDVAVRAVIGRAVPDNLPRAEYAGIILVRHADGRVGLVVLQENVVARLVFLDEVVLQQEGVFFRLDHNVAYVGNLAHEHACLARRVLLAEIGIDAPLQILCLTDVDDDPVLVQVLVDAGAVGQVLHDAAQVFVLVEYFHAPYSCKTVSRCASLGNLARPFSSFSSMTKLT